MTLKAVAKRQGKELILKIPAVKLARMQYLRTRMQPASQSWGLERGVPLDRIYLEDFLGDHRHLITGRVLEIGDRVYIDKFGEDVREPVVYDVVDRPTVDIVGDLASGQGLEPDSYDCMVIAQTLMLVYDVRDAVSVIHRSLKPGGTALVTVNFLAPNGQDECHEMWHWNFSPLGIRKLFAEQFGDEQVSVTPYGNYATASCFLAGLAAQETSVDLWRHEPGYEILVGLRATKAEC